MILFGFLMTIFVHSAVLSVAGQSIEIVRFDRYKQLYGFSDDAACLRQILETRNTNRHVIIRFKGRVYRFDTVVLAKAWVGTVTFEGREGTIFVSKGLMLDAMAANQRFGFTRDISRGDTQLELLRIPDKTKLIKIQSADTVETAWNYTANDLLTQIMQ